MLWTTILLAASAVAADPADERTDRVLVEATAGVFVGGAAAIGAAWGTAQLTGAELQLAPHMSDPWNETTLGVAGAWFAGMSLGASLGVWNTRSFYGDGPEYGRVLGGALMGSAAGAVIVGASTFAWERAPELAVAGLVVGGAIAPIAGAVLAAEVETGAPSDDARSPRFALWATPGRGGGLLGASGSF